MKKTYDKKIDLSEIPYEARVLYGTKRLLEGFRKIAKEAIEEYKPKKETYKEKYLNTLKDLIIYKALANYYEELADMEHTKVIILTIVILIETVAIGFLI